MKSDTLNAGIEAEVIYAAGNSEFVHIRQIPVRDYPKGFSLVENEAALVSFLVSGPAPSGCASPLPAAGQYLGFRPPLWAESLAPASYEHILARGREVNENGFFAYCGRQTTAAQEKLRVQIAAMAQLPPEVMKLAMEQGLRSTSPTSLRG